MSSIGRLESPRSHDDPPRPSLNPSPECRWGYTCEAKKSIREGTEKYAGSLNCTALQITRNSHTRGPLGKHAECCSTRIRICDSMVPTSCRELDVERFEATAAVGQAIARLATQNHDRLFLLTTSGQASKCIFYCSGRDSATEIDADLTNSLAFAVGSSAGPREQARDVTECNARTVSAMWRTQMLAPSPCDVYSTSSLPAVYLTLVLLSIFHLP